MKVKKQKRHRKILTFYTAFRKPFKVLCDGTFVHHLLVSRVTPADKALGNILSATVKLYTTRCVLAELKRLGGSYSEALEAARRLIIARYPVCLSYLVSEMLFSLNLHLHISRNMPKLLKKDDCI